MHLCKASRAHFLLAMTSLCSAVSLSGCLSTLHSSTSFLGSGFSTSSPVTTTPPSQSGGGGVVPSCSAHSAPADPLAGQLSANLVGWWSFYEGCGTSDSDLSGSGNTGTLIGAPNWTSGITGSGALALNGSNQYFTAGTNQVPGVAPLSISAWVQLISAPSAPSTIVNRGDEDGANISFSLRLEGAENNEPVFYADSPVAGGALWAVSSGTTLSLGKWYHIVGTITYSSGSTTGAIYINGELAASSPSSDGIFTAGGFSSSLQIGAGQTGGGISGFFSGGISDVRIYNGALSSADVAKLYGLGTPALMTAAITAPTILVTSSTTATITWYTSAPLTSQVQYGFTTSYGGSTTEVALTQAHSVTLTNLDPNSTYHYRVVSAGQSGSVSSQDYYFSTPLAPVNTSGNIYIAQATNPTGTGDASSCANARGVDYFNNPSSWGTGQIAPGTTVLVCGQIASTLIFGGSGTSSQPITLTCAPGGCDLSQPAGNSVNLAGNSYIILDGGYPCGSSVQNADTTCTGIMENTANGTGLANQRSTVAVQGGGSGTVEIRNWLFRNFYIHQAPINIQSITCVGTACTATLSGPSPYSAGEMGIYISGNSLTAANTGSGNWYGVGAVSGNSFTFTANADATGTGTGGQTSESQIDQTSDCIVTGMAGSVSFHDNTVHDVGWAVLVGTNDTGSVSLDVYNNYFYNYDHGVVPGDPTTNIHDNHFGSTNSWDTLNNLYHHDGIHCYGSQDLTTPCANTLAIYNNLYDGNWGNNNSAHNLFQFKQPNVLQYYNNIHIQQDGVYINDGFDILTMSQGWIVNNTYICDGTVSNQAGLSLGGSGITLENNAFYGCNTFYGNGSATSALTAVDYNAYMSQGSGGNPAWWDTSPSNGTNAPPQTGFLNITNDGAHTNVWPTNYPLFEFNEYSGPITINGSVYTVSSLSGYEGYMTLTTSVSGSPSTGAYSLNGIDIWRALLGSGLEAHSSYYAADGLNGSGVPLQGSPVIGAGANLSTLCSTLPGLCSSTSAGGTVSPVPRSGGAWNIGAY